MTSSILRTATRLLMPLLLLFALFLLFRGHNAPGGGFVGGLVVAAAFILYGIAYGVTAGRRALLIDPSRLLGIGLLVALGAGMSAVLRGRPFLTATWTTVRVDGLSVDVGTPLLFDIGVFFVVIGVVLTIVFALADVVLTEN
jgi:multicomponent Na+:H+ antiporter subunit B